MLAVAVVSRDVTAANGIGDDNQDAKLFSLAKDAGIVAGLCHAIITGEDFFRSNQKCARQRAATEQAEQNPPPMHT